VAETASQIALMHSISVEKAKIAGLLHDSAKYLNPETIKTYGVVCSPSELLVFATHKLIWHAVIAPKLILQLFGHVDSDILNAIKFHTTGNENMDPLSEILFVADYIEPGRSYDDIPYIKSLVETSLREAVFALSCSMLKSLNKRQLPIHYLSQNCHQWYKEILSERADKIETLLDCPFKNI
jgi:predicted HD superfamily hydrolase involved in NAD metabolism